MPERAAAAQLHDTYNTAQQSVSCLAACSVAARQSASDQAPCTAHSRLSHIMCYSCPSAPSALAHDVDLVGDKLGEVCQVILVCLPQAVEGGLEGEGLFHPSTQPHCKEGGRQEQAFFYC